jgi:hypothetical protein
MRWYKILARIFLLLSVIDFALAAPVVLQEHEVRVSVVDAAKGGTATSPLRRDTSNKWLANAADRTNAPLIPRSSESGHWREQEPRQPNPRSRTDSKGSPEPSNPAPPIDLYANNPRSPSPPPGPGSTSPSPSSRAPTADEPDPLNPSSPDESRSSSSRVSPQIASSSDVSYYSSSSPEVSYSSSSWVPTDSDSGSTNSWSSQHYVSPPASSPGPSQDHVPSLPSSKFKSISELMSTTTRVTLPPDGSPQITSSPDESYSASSPGPSQDHVPSPPNLGDHSPSDSHSLTTTEYFLGSPDQSSTGKSHPPIPGPTDNHPPPASSSNPGPSMEPNPPPSAKRPRPEEHDFWSFLSKLPKGKFKRRFSGTGGLAGPGYLQL